MQHKSNLSLSLLRNVSNPRLPGKAACLSKCRNAYDYINAYQPASMESCVLKLRLLGCLPEWMHIFIKSHLPACLCGCTSSSDQRLLGQIYASYVERVCAAEPKNDYTTGHPTLFTSEKRKETTTNKKPNPHRFT